MECAGLGIWLTVDPVKRSSIFRRDVADNYFTHGFSFSPLNPLNIKVFTALIRVKNVKMTLQTRMIMIIIVMRSREVARQPEKARHCSHCFQYYLASLSAGFFFACPSSVLFSHCSMLIQLF
jgi:hypothetical protein